MNNNKYKYNLAPRYVLLFSTVILVGLIFLSYRFPEVFNPVKTKATSFMMPMQKSITMLGCRLRDTKDNFEKVDELQKENETLKAEYDELKAKYDNLLADSYELENLRSLFELSQTYSEYEKVGANIISTDSSGYKSLFTVDKGAKDGIKKDMNVISGNGLVGIVIQVGDNYSTIRTIIDNNSNVSASILKTSESCMVSGNMKRMDEGCIDVKEIPLTSTVRNNYQVMTSALSSKYLPGILIGYISNVSSSPDGLTKEGGLTPAVDFNSLETVLIIKDLKENIITE